MDLGKLADEKLAQLAARETSDGPAFAELIHRHRERVWRLCYRLMGNQHDAADAAQEVFVRLFVNRTKFAGKSKYTTWLHSVTVNTCLTIRRSRSRRIKRVGNMADEVIDQQTSDDQPADAALTHDLQEMLSILSEDDRALLILKYTENYQFEELATMFNLSLSACKMRVQRAREKLKEQFPDQMID